MRAPVDIFRNFETTVSTLTELQTAIDDLVRLRLSGPEPKLFTYRGVANAEFAFHSSLYRRLWWTKAVLAGTPLLTTAAPTEPELDEAEERILADAHRWGLHDTDQGRRPILPQLALQQHNHAPTRLIDVSFNIWTALWFAVEPTWKDGRQEPDIADGRLFLIDVTTRLINETAERAWENSLVRPWPHGPAATTTYPNQWTTHTRAWRPSPQDRRIAAQQGGFLFGGVPDSDRQYPASTTKNDILGIEEVRRLTSLPLRFYKSGARHGGAAVGNAAYTWRIRAGVKGILRERLERMNGLSTARIYPDIAGFGSHATPYLLSNPP